MLNDFIDLFSSRGSTPGVAVHIGAGLCDELPIFIQLGFKRILLVEANSKFADKLAAKTKDFDNVEVRNALVNDNGANRFYRTSIPRFDSLKKPSALSEFYPNLEIHSESEVETQSLDHLLQQCSLDAVENNLLILEVQGAELEILEKTSRESLQKFSWIVIKTSAQALYEQAAQSADLNPFLESMAFELSATEKLNFPFLVNIYKRNDATIKLTVLNSDIEELKNALSAALEENDESKKALSELLDESEESKKALSDALKSLNMNSKLLVKAQADNESLRQKYSEKVDSEESMFKLINKLRDRLQAAADFYGQLEKDHPEIIHEQNRIISDSNRE